MPPFTFVGLDYAGPLYIKTETAEPKKVWICLLTCCDLRAIHLELVVDLTAQAFIRTFQRFVARRGLPSKLVSDNSKTFKSASNDIAKIMNHLLVQHYLAGIRVEWQFNLEKAPGGVGGSNA